MKNIKSKIVYGVVIMLVFTSICNAQNEFNKKQIEIIETMNSLSETTSPKGNGAKAYGKFLADDFSRWTIGNDKIIKKKEWVEGIKDWFEEGWRVSDREQKNLEIDIRDAYAFTRRIVIETYLGPKGDTSKSKAALAEVWVNLNNHWQLLKVTVHPLTME